MSLNVCHYLRFMCDDFYSSLDLTVKKKQIRPSFSFFFTPVDSSFLVTPTPVSIFLEFCFIYWQFELLSIILEVGKYPALYAVGNYANNLLLNIW